MEKYLIHIVEVFPTFNSQDGFNMKKRHNLIKKTNLIYTQNYKCVTMCVFISPAVWNECLALKRSKGAVLNQHSAKWSLFLKQKKEIFDNHDAQL